MLNVWGSRFRKAESHHVAIFKGILTVALFSLLAKSMSAGKEMAVAYRYGLAAEVDAYQFLFNLISWPIGIWTSVLTAVLVPLAARMRASGKEVLPHFRSELFGFAILLGIVLALLAWAGIGTLLASKKSGLPFSSAHLAQVALPSLALLLPLGMLAALQSAWMLSANRHLNTLLEIIPAIFIAASVLLFANPGIDPLVWGTVIGSSVHLLGLLLLATRRGELEAPVFSRISSQWQSFWQGFGIMLIGQALLSFTVVIDQFHAIGFGTGSVATLGYANRILSLILSLAAIAVSRATLPIFSQATVAGPEKEMHRVAMYWSRLMFMAGIAVMLMAYAMAPVLVRLLFERGQFGADDTRIVVDALRYGLPQLPFYFSCMVLVSYALSQRRYGLIFWSGVLGCAAKILGNILLAPALGINGIALAATWIYGLNASFFWLTLRR